LDELGECDPPMQTKLLSVLQPPPGRGPCAREFRRVGATEPTRCNVRIIAANNCDLVEAINQGRFREDLYYRLAVVTLQIPPLRDRKTDIPLIAEGLLKKINDDFHHPEQPGYRDKRISDATKRLLREYPSPGNIRQLHNALVQAAAFAEGDVL